jgi:hypothetical protein
MPCTVMDFEQWKFDLQTENNRAKELDDETYLGTWNRHDNDLHSWRVLSGVCCAVLCCVVCSFVFV